MKIPSSGRAALTRRHFFGKTATGVGSMALAHLLGPRSRGGATLSAGLAGLPHFAPKAKRIIYLFQSGGPSQLETFDPKPGLKKTSRARLARVDPQGPAVDDDDRRADQLSLVESAFGFRRHGRSGAWISELLPHTAKIADRLVLHPLAAYRSDQS